ncbi:MAG: 5-formyltetrahydrofolate cyclo-ligase [Micavibrio aeruginosavorus]|nr:5-formyltetrahydrofolate cyclo-ligase [Micavibrio aeruginosavorus]
MRHEALLHRDRIDPREESAEDACENFLKSIDPEPDQIVALYWPKGREFDTIPLLHELLTRGLTCALPVIEKGSRVLKFASWKEGDPLIKGPFGVMQPVADEKTVWVDPDIFVIPYLAFDRHGHRLGYGGGYYDTTLRHYREKKKILSVGYGYGQQAVLFNLPAEDHDEKLDWIIT